MLVLEPVLKVFERVEQSRRDPERLFTNLLYAGETVMKVAVAGMVAAVTDDRDRHRYRHEHALVRASGIGEWAAELDRLLTGPTAQYLLTEAQVEKKELSEWMGATSWQSKAACAMHQCLQIVRPGGEPLGRRLTGRVWFRFFTEVRNKTRGHGAPTGQECRDAGVELERAVRLFADNFSLFQRSWAHLKQTNIGKYQVTPLGGDDTPFRPLARTRDRTLPDGVYMWLGDFVRVDLLYGEAGSQDVLLPNGAFNGRRFEVRSLATNEVRQIDAAPYLTPAGTLPESETEGSSELELVGQTLSNIPAVAADYVDRPGLQDELSAKLTNRARYPLVTLTGRGGIGKTSLALRVLHGIANEGDYFAILWFSARDIDLLAHGPAPVRPRVVAVDDMAKEYARLTGNDPSGSRGAFEAALTESPFGQPLLFVFDNFETVQSPAELYRWIDAYVRPPNKVLITTRIRDFKGDYPLQVRGMEEDEARELISATAERLRIGGLLTLQYVQQLIDEADGHPYIIKILLGEVAKARKIGPIERVVADQDEVLTALFERTYTDLSPLAKRVFLTVCSWRSVIPELAIRALVLQNATEPLDVGGAVEELERVSFIDVLQSDDGDAFVTAPLSAAAFGRQKLVASPYRSAVEADAQLLFEFGAAQRADIRRGLAPRIARFVQNVRRRIRDEGTTLAEAARILDYLARHHAPAWLLLAELYEEEGDGERALDALRRYLETGPVGIARLDGWRRLRWLAAREGHTIGEVQALVEIASAGEADMHEASGAASDINRLLSENVSAVDRYEKEVLVRRAAEALMQRIGEADAADCSRIARLHIHLGDEGKAAEVTEKGLSLDPNNDHCYRLGQKLGLFSP